MKVSIKDPIVRKIVRTAYPDYAGRKIAVKPRELPIRLDSYWSGGSRSYYVILRLVDMAISTIPQNGTPFDHVSLGKVTIPTGFVIVEHCIFCGEDLGIRIHANPNDLARLLTGSVQ